MMYHKEYLDLLRSGLLSIVKDILVKISNYGLEGNQNLILRFYNNFENQYLFEDQFTTITIQNNNQELSCDDYTFSVNVKINGFNKRLTIPFEAVALVLDPSARFGLELGQVYDDYKINVPKEEQKNLKNDVNLPFSVVSFDQEINIKKNFFSSEKSTDYQIDYIYITRYHLLNVIKNLLDNLNNNLLNKKKTFLIEFKKNYPGVILPTNLSPIISKNQELITISLREKFFNLTVENDFFSVILSFNNKLQKITIPYKAITNLFDPDSNFKVDLTFVDFVDEHIIEQNNNRVTFLDFNS